MIFIYYLYNKVYLLFNLSLSLLKCKKAGLQVLGKVLKKKIHSINFIYNITCKNKYYLATGIKWQINMILPSRNEKVGCI